MKMRIVVGLMIMLCVWSTAFSQTQISVKQIKSSSIYPEEINCVSFISKDCSNILVGTGNRMKAIFKPDSVKAQLNIWNVSTGDNTENIYSGKMPVIAIGTSFNRKLIANALTDNEFTVFDYEKKQLIGVIPTTGMLDGLTFTPDNLFLVCAYSKSIEIYDVDSLRLVGSIETPHDILRIAVCPSYIAATLIGEKVGLWSTVGRTLIKEFDMSEFGGAFSIMFTNDYSQLVIGTYSGDIIFLDINYLKVLRVLKGHFKRVNALSISKDSKYLLSSSDDQSFKVWNLKTGTELKSISNIHKGEVNNIQFCDSNSIFFTTGEDRIVRVWKIN